METQQKEKKCCWYLCVLYNVILYGIIVVSGAILFMVMVGMIQIEGNEKKKKIWIEVNSQILNGVFTWMALTNHPGFMKRIYHILRLVKTQKRLEDENEDKKEKSALYLRHFFPILFTDKTPQHQFKTKTIGFEMKNLIQLRNIYLLLNCCCLFQYPITIVMWFCSASTRPGYIIGFFLPLSFVCNIGGQYKLFQLKKNHKQKKEEIGRRESSDVIAGATTTTSVPTPTLTSSKEIELEESIPSTRSPKSEFTAVRLSEP
jgi:hypothetical protein